MVEVRGAPEVDLPDLGPIAEQLEASGLRLDRELEAVPMGEYQSGASRKPRSFIIYGSVTQESQIQSLEAQPEVIKVWHDTTIAPF